MKKRNMAKWYLPVLGIWAVLLVVVAVLQSFNTSAKYTMTKETDAEAVAQAFYFESDLLDGGTYELPAGTTEIAFTLRNHADDLRAAECEIGYKIYLNGTEKTDGSMTANTVVDADITLAGLTAGTYTVKAVAVSPYAAELSATFKIPEKDMEVYYTVTDSANSPVVALTVSTVDYEGSVTIKWPSSVHPDNTDPKLAGAVGVTSATVAYNKNSEYTFLFFKDDPATVYTKTSFTVN